MLYVAYATPILDFETLHVAWTLIVLSGYTFWDSMKFKVFIAKWQPQSFIAKMQIPCGNGFAK